MVRVMNRISIDNRVKLYREIENHLQEPNHTLFGVAVPTSLIESPSLISIFIIDKKKGQDNV